MFEVFARTIGHRPGLWAVIDDNNCPLALFLPVQITLKNGIMQHFTSRAVAYGSVLNEQTEAGTEALGMLLANYVRNDPGSLLFTELRNLSDYTTIQPVFHLHHFIYEDHLNYLIDLDRSPQDLFQSIRSRTRKKIRLALRRGDVIIEEIKERSQLKPWYAILCKTYKNARVPLADLSLFESAFDILSPKGMIRFTQARVNQAIAATSVELLYRDNVYGWYGGADRAYSYYGANELLTWNILSWASKNGYKVYDFGGAGRPNRKYGVRDFKAKFGGRLVSYGRNSFVHRQIRLWLVKLGYELTRGWLG
jgi:serine/alanine adding enzyme